MSEHFRARLVKALEALVKLAESQMLITAGTVFVSPQQPLAELSTCLWQIRRGDFSRLLYVWLLVAPGGPVSRLAEVNGLKSCYEELLSGFAEAFKALYLVRYAGTEVAIQLGDHVQLKGLFGKSEGRVSYLPGQPRHSSELDFGGICRVGVQTARGAFVAVHVDPHSLEAKGSLRFVSRDAKEVPSVPSEEELKA
jgi:hypothetical protein